MEIKNNQGKYTIFRNKYKNFIFDSFNVTYTDESIVVEYVFVIEGLIVFKPKTIFFINKLNSEFSKSDFNVLAFYLGMVEAVSYWKSCCCTNFIIKPFKLKNQHLDFFRKLYFHGLGEFFYLNNIEPNFDDFINFVQASDKYASEINFSNNSNSFIVPIGGGKDSIISLEFLKHYNYDIFPMMVNPRAAMTDTVKVASIDNSKVLISNRNIDANLLKLNDQGFLNGHTPFSALLAFQSLIFAYANGINNIALSNESSANESTVPGTKINHQYSKSIEFETDFRSFVKNFISTNFNYFSVLRPLSELQIASVLTKHSKYFPVFKSCNVGSKTNTWCGACPKCLFTAIMLLPFLPLEKINEIFNKEIFNDSKLLTTFHQLTGEQDVKPFECVGTVSEVKLALYFGINNQLSDFKLPFLLNEYKESELSKNNSKFELKEEISVFEDNNFLSEKMYEQLQEYIRINN